MTRVSACDGRYLSLAQQKRAWEELNRIFGGQTPTPPGPDPDPPDPPSPVVSGNVVYYYQGDYVDDLIVQEGIGDRVMYFNIPGPGELPVVRPFICLSGKKEIVSLWTYITGEQDPIQYMQLSYGLVSPDGQYDCINHYEREWNQAWVKELMISETFYDDGAGHVYYQCNLDFDASFGPLAPYMFLERFDYPTDLVEKVVVSFYGMNAMRESGILGFVGTISASFYSSS